MEDLDDAPTVTVDFDYQVGDVRYVGKQQWYRTLFGGPAKYSEANYWRGNTVLVYYNPTNPAEAVVAPELFNPGLAVFAVMLIMFLGLALVCLGVRVPVRSFVSGKEKSQGT